MLLKLRVVKVPPGSLALEKGWKRPFSTVVLGDIEALLEQISHTRIRLNCPFLWAFQTTWLSWAESDRIHVLIWKRAGKAAYL